MRLRSVVECAEQKAGKNRRRRRQENRLKDDRSAIFFFVTSSYQADLFSYVLLCIWEKRLKHYLCLFNKQHRSEIIKGEGSNTHLLFFILSQLVFDKAIQCTLSIITTMQLQEPSCAFWKKYVYETLRKRLTKNVSWWIIARFYLIL